MDGSLQHWLDRNRPPRVQITYDVETLGATVKQEIPFIVGIIGDFAGSAPQGSIADRTFVEIDRDNIKDVMAKLQPALQLAPKPLYQVTRAPDGNTYRPASGPGTTPFAASLTFGVMEDFGPISIIKQVPELAALMQTRRNLADLMAKLGTNPGLEAGLWTQAATALSNPGKTPPPADPLTTAGTALATAKGAYDDAAAAVLPVEGEPNRSAITATQQVVTDAQSAFTAAMNPPTADSQKSADPASGGSTGTTTGSTGDAGPEKSADPASGGSTGTTTDSTGDAGKTTPPDAPAVQTTPSGAPAVQLTPAQRQAAGAAAWQLATAIRDGVAQLSRITAAYSKDDPKQGPALGKVTPAQDAIDDMITAAAQAALSTASAAAVAVAVAQAA
jgi:type VI secretion system protein ImpB